MMNSKKATICLFTLAAGIGMVPLAHPIERAVAAEPDKAPALRWNTGILRQPDSFYRSDAAKIAADNVLRYQSVEGGWPKNLDLTVDPGSAENLAKLVDGKANTIDNGATTLPIRFLAKMAAVQEDARYRTAAERGIDYLLRAQYPNGGWPQFFPLIKGYYSNITFNDDAMVHALELLRDVASGRNEFKSTNARRRKNAADAVQRGISVILRTQLKVDGKLAGWCAQYDPQTLSPAWARRYEPPSLSGAESIGIIRFLMETEPTTPEIAAAVDGAVGWLEKAAIKNLRWDDFINAEGQPDRRVVPAESAPRLWARFYELGTSRPIFLGRSSEVHYQFADIERERRIGYNYYGSWAEELLTHDYPAWKQKRIRH